jgi:tellurite resistance protein TerC
VADLGLLSKKDAVITLKKALAQTIFWVVLALAFCAFIWFENGTEDALQYVSAYLLEWSLSIDNIFVFIIIFSFFGVKESNYSRVLLLGILMAVVFRILFIALGSELGGQVRLDHVHFWCVPCLYRALKCLPVVKRKDFNPEQNWAFRLIKKFMPLTHEEPRRAICHKEK